MRKVLVAVPLILGSSLGVGLLGSQSPLPAQDPLARREEAYRSANLGVALVEQFRFAEGADALRKALALDPGFAAARVNLAIALLYVPDPAAARAEAERARELLPNAPQPPYVLGLIARTENRTEDAVAAFRRVLELDPQDVGANIGYGQMRLQEKAYDEALAAFDVALRGEPYNVTAAYNRGIALTRAGKREEGAQAMALFQQLRDSNYRTNLGQNYLEQGRYAQAVASTGAEPELVDGKIPEVSFVDRSAAAMPPPAPAPGHAASSAARTAGVTLADLDSDGALDVVLARAEGVQVLHNEAGRFKDRTAAAGLAGLRAFATVAGDYDNDGRLDLMFLRGDAGPALYHNEGGGRFTNVSSALRLSESGGAATAAFLDVDHDGDLDVFVGGVSGGPSRVRLLRNNGDGTFADLTSEAKLDAVPGLPIAVVPTDFDNRRDIDLLVAYRDRAPALFKNMRDGTFRDVAGEVGLASVGPLTGVAAADFNKDDFTDFFFTAATGPGWMAASNGRGGFTVTPGPPETERATFAQFVDYDLDGLIDLFLMTERGPRMLRNLGGTWSDVSSRATPAALAAGLSSAYPAIGDLDGDGDQDLLLGDPRGGSVGALRLWVNEGGNKNRSLRVALTGRVSNRTGVGAKVEMRAGSLRQKIETSSAVPAVGPADVVFGLGARTQADAIRVLWSSGILQTETELPAVPATGTRTALSVTELDRKPSSCPFLYAWDGAAFGFVTDFLGGGEMGYWLAPGVRNVPDPDEYVRVRADQLRARNGRYELRVTNELEEVLFVDRLELFSVDHPADVLLFPDEGMTNPPKAFRLLAARDPRSPTAAVDDAGRDVLGRIVAVDRTYPDSFPLHRLRGYAAPHALTLDLGGLPAAHTRLLLTGWTNYAFSSDNVAASQAGLALAPPVLEVRGADGTWVKAVDLAIPVGRPQTQVVDLQGRFPTADRHVRIVTNMRIYWDQIVAAVPATDVRLEVARHPGRRADLRERGFSAVVAPDGREPYSYAYERVSWDSPWKVMPGRYTREGDVRELLEGPDDLFVVSRPGDAIELSFEAGRPVAPGNSRTFFFYANGYSKEMDINSSSPDVVLPLPFHGMKGYPYVAGQESPRARAQAARAASFNTRVVQRPLMALELAAAHRSGAAPREGEAP